MKIVVTRELPGHAFDELREHDIEVLNFGSETVTEDRLIEAARNADAIVSLLSDPITSRVIKACDRLKVVAQFAVGYDNIDVEAARKRGVVVTNTPGVLTNATADFAFTLLLAAARKILSADRYVRDGKFERWETNLLLGTNLYGKTIGIVGLGRIGAAMARRAIGFGMKVLYHSRSRANLTVERVLSAKQVPMSRLLKQSDVISLHCSLNRQSHHLINAKRFDQMKSTAILINTARGAVVDEQALVDALQSGKIAAAGLDVFEDEPAVHPALIEMDNVVLAPHLGSATRETRTRMAEMCVEALQAVFDGADDIPYRVA